MNVRLVCTSKRRVPKNAMLGPSTWPSSITSPVLISLRGVQHGRGLLMVHRAALVGRAPFRRAARAFRRHGPGWSLRLRGRCRQRKQQSWHPMCEDSCVASQWRVLWNGTHEADDAEVNRGGFKAPERGLRQFGLRAMALRAAPSDDRFILRTRFWRERAQTRENGREEIMLRETQHGSRDLSADAAGRPDGLNRDAGREPARFLRKRRPCRDRRGDRGCDAVLEYAGRADPARERARARPRLHLRRPPPRRARNS